MITAREVENSKSPLWEYRCFSEKLHKVEEHGKAGRPKTKKTESYRIMKQIIKNIYHVGDNGCSVYLVDTQSERRTAASWYGVRYEPIKLHKKFAADMTLSFADSVVAVCAPFDLVVRLFGFYF